MHKSIAAIINLIISVSALSAHATTARGEASCPIDRQRLVAPVRGTVRQSFSITRCRGCATSRGLTIDVAPGTQIRATGEGEVVFSGNVADRWWVVQELTTSSHSDNHVTGNHVTDKQTSASDVSGDNVRRKISVTYGGFDVPPRAVVAGAQLRRGEEIGAAGNRVYVGIRVDGRYVDPFPCWGGRRARLLPAAHVGRAELPR